MKLFKTVNLPIQYPYLTNKYTQWYYNIINNALIRSTLSTYVELHHIIPRCMRGSNKTINLVPLTPREHVICHWLLTKMTVGDTRRKMVCALWYMCHNGRNMVNSRLYEIARLEYINTPLSDDSKKKMSDSKKGRYIEEDNPNFGNHWTDEQKLAASIRLKGLQSGENNPMFGRIREDTSARNSLPKRWITDGINDKLILREDTDNYLSIGYWIGRSNLDIAALSKAISDQRKGKPSSNKGKSNLTTKGTRWWHTDKKQVKQKDCPGNGWILGRLDIKGKPAHNKGKPSPRKGKSNIAIIGYKWWTDGINQLFQKGSPGINWRLGRQ